jgi:Glycolipid transfer protein (GLTP)
MTNGNGTANNNGPLQAQRPHIRRNYQQKQRCWIVAIRHISSVHIIIAFVLLKLHAPFIDTVLRSDRPFIIVTATMSTHLRHNNNHHSSTAETMITNRPTFMTDPILYTRTRFDRRNLQSKFNHPNKRTHAAAAVVTFQDHQKRVVSNEDVTTTSTTTATTATGSGTTSLSSFFGGVANSSKNRRQEVRAKPVIRVINTSKTKPKKKYVHPALSFLEPPEVMQEKFTGKKSKTIPSIAVTQPKITTRVGELAKKFSSVLKTTSTSMTMTSTAETLDNNTIIDMDQLLVACHQFVQAMVDVEQKLSARDLRNNIAKVESLYHTVQKQQSHHATSTVPYHSMEALLRYEKEQKIHKYEEINLSNSTIIGNTNSQPRPRLIALNEQSCAMGLLWIRRSLQFQYHLFHSLLQDIDATDATLHAYEQTLQPFHSWALQQVYNVAVKSATPSNHIWLGRLGGYDTDTNTTETTIANRNYVSDAEHATRRDLLELLHIWKPLIEQWETIYAELNLEDQRRV